MEGIFSTALGLHERNVQTQAGYVRQHPQVAADVKFDVSQGVDAGADQNEEEGVKLEGTGRLRRGAGVEEGEQVETEQSRYEGLNVTKNAECGYGYVLERHGRCDDVGGEQKCAGSPRQHLLQIECTGCGDEGVGCHDKCSEGHLCHQHPSSISGSNGNDAFVGKNHGNRHKGKKSGDADAEEAVRIFGRRRRGGGAGAS